jgi:mono/diheme cytochrome c family protein
MIDTSLTARLLRGTTAGLVLLVGAASFPSLAAENGDEAINPHAGDPAAIARGADLFAARCVFCHGGQGRGAKAQRAAGCRHGRLLSASRTYSPAGQKIGERR